jgi:hypothetical protein
MTAVKERKKGTKARRKAKGQAAHSVHLPVVGAEAAAAASAQVEDPDVIARRVRRREKRNRRQQLEHVKKQALDVLAAYKLTRYGHWQGWCRDAGLSQPMAWMYRRFGEALAANEIAELSENEQWKTWQRISGHPPKTRRQEGEDVVVEDESSGDGRPRQSRHSTRPGEAARVRAVPAGAGEDGEVEETLLDRAK